jgi:hypothetical protein
MSNDQAAGPSEAGPGPADAALPDDKPNPAALDLAHPDHISHPWPEWRLLVKRIHGHNARELEESRRVDLSRLPEPEKLTVGDLIDILTFLAGNPQVGRPDPSISQMCNRRDLLLSASPGFRVFLDWKSLEFHRGTPVEAAPELEARLVERLRKPSEVVRLMPLMDALLRLAQSKAASPAALGRTPRPTLDPAGRAVGAAYALQRAGKPVSVRAACKDAGVDRNNLAVRHPEIVQLLEKMAKADRSPPTKATDRRTGNLDGWNGPEDDDSEDDDLEDD